MRVSLGGGNAPPLNETLHTVHVLILEYKVGIFGELLLDKKIHFGRY